ncbi:MAG: hypothetical protein IJ144_01390 [Prevotella sp.]|nr:hypothetical protein [Prevotella sp.]
MNITAIRHERRRRPMRFPLQNRITAAGILKKIRPTLSHFYNPLKINVIQ